MPPFLNPGSPATLAEVVEASVIAWETSFLRQMGVFALMDSLHEQSHTGVLTDIDHPRNRPFFDRLTEWHYITNSPDNPLEIPVIDATTQAIAGPLFALAQSTTRFAAATPLPGHAALLGPVELDLEELSHARHGLQLAMETNVKSVLMNRANHLQDLVDLCQRALLPAHLASLGIGTIEAALAKVNGAPVDTWSYNQVIDGGMNLTDSLIDPHNYQPIARNAPPIQDHFRAASQLLEGARGLGILPTATTTQGMLTPARPSISFAALSRSVGSTMVARSVGS